jgi:hypothetical protein
VGEPFAGAGHDGGMEHDEPISEADALEQAGPEETGEIRGDLNGSLGERPEADALEQAQPVEGVQVRVVSRPEEHRDEVSEADWLEQSVVEPLDEDEPR